MTWILLTNDDGIDSPALAPFAAALGALGEVRVCVPDAERSWVGKSITRFEDISVARREDHGGAETWACSGTPADTAQVGIHTIWPEPPSLVVSGINVGSNAGTAFLLSSGTVGAALEGWIAGIPSIAVSTRSSSMSWGEWMRLATSAEGAPGWDRLSQVSAQIVDDINRAGLAGVADVVTVNLPWETTVTTPRRITDVARVGYGPLFAVHADDPSRRTFTFDGTLVAKDDLAGTDIDVLDRGEVAITPLRAPGAVAVDQSMRDTLEQPPR